MGFLKRNILYVDDDPMSISLVDTMLSQAGYAVTCASDGFEGLDLLYRYPFDLVLLDVVMAPMNGVDMLKRLKAQPETWEIPVMMLSVRDDEKIIERCMSTGAIDYVLKPPPREVLLRKIETILGGRPRFAEVGVATDTRRGICDFVFQARVISIGEAGMAISCSMRLDVGSYYRIEAELFREIGISTPTFKVVHCQEDKSRYVVYVNFLGLKTEEVAAVREWVVTQALRGRTVA